MLFYKATVQSVLLFGSETWVFAPTTIKRVEGFHVNAGRCMTGLLPKMSSGMWKYSKLKTVLVAASLHTNDHCVQVRRAHIMRWVIDMPILKLFRLSQRWRGTTPRLCWWEQPKDLDEASAGALTDTTTDGVRRDGGRAP